MRGVQNVHFDRRVLVLDRCLVADVWTGGKKEKRTVINSAIIVSFFVCVCAQFFG